MRTGSIVCLVIAATSPLGCTRDRHDSLQAKREAAISVFTAREGSVKITPMDRAIRTGSAKVGIATAEIGVTCKIRPFPAALWEPFRYRAEPLLTAQVVGMGSVRHYWQLNGDSWSDSLFHEYQAIAPNLSYSSEEVYRWIEHGGPQYDAHLTVTSDRDPMISSSAKYRIRMHAPEENIRIWVSEPFLSEEIYRGPTTSVSYGFPVIKRGLERTVKTQVRLKFDGISQMSPVGQKWVTDHCPYPLTVPTEIEHSWKLSYDSPPSKRVGYLRRSFVVHRWKVRRIVVTYDQYGPKGIERKVRLEGRVFATPGSPNTTDFVNEIVFEEHVNPPALVLSR